MASETVFNNLSKFVFKRVLNNSSDRKVIFLEASLENGEKLVVILEKKAFTEEIAKQLFSKSSILNKEFINDVYGSYECIPDVKLNGIKTTVIYPATEDHIKKFQFQPFHVIEESPKAYESITLPYVIENKLSLQWVHNILDHKTEVDRIVFEDFDKEAGFVLLPDLKWDGKQIETLYLLAICHCRNIKSLRDLNASHLPLLKIF